MLFNSFFSFIVFLFLQPVLSKLIFFFFFCNTTTPAIAVTTRTTTMTNLSLAFSLLFNYSLNIMSVMQIYYQFHLLNDTFPWFYIDWLICGSDAQLPSWHLCFPLSWRCSSFLFHIGSYFCSSLAFLFSVHSLCWWNTISTPFWIWLHDR